MLLVLVQYMLIHPMIMSNKTLNICSLNVHGLGNYLKRKKTFKFLQDTMADITLIQETHAVKSTNHIWETEFGNKIIFAYGTSQSCGVATLIHNKEIKVCKITRDIQGRFLLCKIKFGQDTYSLANIYAPVDQDKLEFFDTIQAEMTKIKCEFWILGGDFNIVIDPQIDQMSDHVYKPLARSQIISLTENFELTNIWWHNNPEDRKYTWFRHKPKVIASRIDYFLISDCLVNKTLTCAILPCTLSDHSAIKLCIETESPKRGPGMWRFNNSVLNNDAFVEHVRNYIIGIKRIYSYLDPTEFWELLKSEIITVSKKFCCKRAKANKIYRCNLYKTMELLQGEIINSKGGDEQLKYSFDNVKAAIDSSLEQEAKSAAFISRCRFIKDGECSTKYFLVWPRETML